jgi:hypothetical protein
MTRLYRLSIDHLYIIIASAAVFVACYGLWSALNTSAPLHYTQVEYTPERSIYAPGETMVYTPALEVKRAGRVDVLRSFWSRSADESATLCNGESAPTITVTRNLPTGTVGNVRGGRAVRVEIPDLPPGDYLLLSSASGPVGGQSVYEVRFSVRQAC